MPDPTDRRDQGTEAKIAVFYRWQLVCERSQTGPPNPARAPSRKSCFPTKNSVIPSAELTATIVYTTPRSIAEPFRSRKIHPKRHFRHTDSDQSHHDGSDVESFSHGTASSRNSKPSLDVKLSPNITRSPIVARWLGCRVPLRNERECRRKVVL